MQWADTIDFGRCDSEENGNHMKIDATEFRLREGDEVDLGLWATKVKPLCKSNKAYRKILQDHVEQLSDQQRRFYAPNRHALLLVFQAMDTAGKDGAIRHVMSGINPQDCQMFSF
jgi:polyphosphate kinase 2 (PPK2 family)